MPTQLINKRVELEIIATHLDNLGLTVVGLSSGVIQNCDFAKTLRVSQFQHRYNGWRAAEKGNTEPMAEQINIVVSWLNNLSNLPSVSRQLLIDQFNIDGKTASRPIIKKVKKIPPKGPMIEIDQLDFILQLIAKNSRIPTDTKEAVSYGNVSAFAAALTDYTNEFEKRQISKYLSPT